MYRNKTKFIKNRGHQNFVESHINKKKWKRVNRFQGSTIIRGNRHKKTPKWKPFSLSARNDSSTLFQNLPQFHEEWSDESFGQRPHYEKPSEKHSLFGLPPSLAWKEISMCTQRIKWHSHYSCGEAILSYFIFFKMITDFHGFNSP